MHHLKVWTDFWWQYGRGSERCFRVWGSCSYNGYSDVRFFDSFLVGGTALSVRATAKVKFGFGKPRASGGLPGPPECNIVNPRASTGSL